jgi:hypothetical protein
MEASLLILVTAEKYMHHVVSLTKAARERGKKVYVLFSGRGVKLIQEPAFKIIEKCAHISICEASFREYGLADQAEKVPATATAHLANQVQHAEIMARVDRHIVL